METTRCLAWDINLYLASIWVSAAVSRPLAVEKRQSRPLPPITNAIGNRLPVSSFNSGGASITASEFSLRSCRSEHKFSRAGLLQAVRADLQLRLRRASRPGNVRGGWIG